MSKHLFIVGVRKCGTTSVFDSLAGDARFAAPRVKEPQFFTQPEGVISEHQRWYNGLWKEDRQGVRLDGSTLYYQFPESYSRVMDLCPDPFFLLCLRDPARRFYSAYWHMRSKPGGVEKRPLGQLLGEYQKITSLPVEARVTSENKMVQRAISRGEIDGGYLNAGYLRKHYRAPFDTNIPDPHIFFKYFGESLYHVQYPRFEDLPGRMVILFEDFLREPDRVLQQIIDSLGKYWELPDQFSKGLPPAMAPNYNKTLDANHSFLMRWLTRVGWYDTLKYGLGVKGKQLVKRALYGQIPKITESEYAVLRELLREEYDFWAEKLPATKDIWKYRA